MSAAIILCQQGFEDVSSMEGGIVKWPYMTLRGFMEEVPSMITGISEVRDLLILIIRFEAGSRDFYMLAQSKVQSVATQDIFKMLHSAESEHIEYAYKLSRKLLINPELPALSEITSKTSFPYMEGKIEINAALMQFDTKIVDETEAIELAIEKEYMSNDFYKRAVVVVADSNMKIALNEMAAAERQHADVLLKRLVETLK